MDRNKEVWNMLNEAGRRKVLRLTGGWVESAKLEADELKGSEAEAVFEYLADHSIQEIAAATEPSATVRLDSGPRNGMPGRDKVVKIIDGIFGREAWKPYNHSAKYWQNDEATLVIKVDPEATRPFGTAEILGIAKNGVANADEVHTERAEDGYTIIGFWWD